MDLRDLPRSLTEAAEPPVAAADPYQLAAQLGAEVAGLLTEALEQVDGLAAGRVERAGLYALRERIARARRIGIAGQQLGRLDNPAAPRSHRRVDLAVMLGQALRQRAREIDGSGLEVRQVVTSATVTGDEALGFTLLQAIIDWALEHAASRVDLTLEVQGWPSMARLACAFAHCPPDEAEGFDVSRLDTVSWRLVERAAAVFGARIARRDRAGRSLLSIEFVDAIEPRVATMGGTLLRLDAADAEPAPPPPEAPRLLADRHVLVLAGRHDLRGVIGEALRPLGPEIEFVDCFEKVAAFCTNAVPHVVVYEHELGGPRMARLRTQLRAAVPDLIFVEIADEGRGFETLAGCGCPYVRVARDAVAGSLAAALGFELTRLDPHGG